MCPDCRLQKSSARHLLRSILLPAEQSHEWDGRDVALNSAFYKGRKREASAKFWPRNMSKRMRNKVRQKGILCHYHCGSVEKYDCRASLTVTCLFWGHVHDLVSGQPRKRLPTQVCVLPPSVANVNASEVSQKTQVKHFWRFGVLECYHKRSLMLGGMMSWKKLKVQRRNAMRHRRLSFNFFFCGFESRQISLCKTPACWANIWRFSSEKERSKASTLLR